MGRRVRRDVRAVTSPSKLKGDAAEREAAQLIA